MAKKPTYEELEQRVKELEKGPNEKARLGDRLHLSLAIGQSSEGIAVADLDGKLEYLNDAFSMMHGYSSEELIGKNLSIFHTPEQLPSVAAANRQSNEKGDFKGEIWHVRRDGTEFPSLMHNSQIKDDEGKPIYMLHTLRDITHIKQAQDALRRSEEKYRSVFEQSRDPIVITTFKGEFVDLNSAVMDLFGYQREEIMKMNFQELYADPDEGYRFQKMMKDKGSIQNFESELRKKDGEIFNCMFDVVRHQGENGGSSAYQGIIRDVTEIKRAQEALQESEKKYRRLVENALVGAYQVEKEGKFIVANRKMAEMFGYDSPESFISSVDSFADLYARPEERPVILREIDEKGSVYGKELEFKRKDGESFWVKFDTRVIRDEENIYYEGVLEDITFRKQAEEALRESEQKYRSLVESSDDSIYLVDRNYTYLFMNEKHLSRLSLKPDELLGRTYAEFHSEGDTQGFSAIVEEVFNTGRPIQQEHRSPRDDRYFLRTFSPVKNPGGNTTSVTVVSKDITERVRSEKALRESEEKLARSNKMEAMGLMAGGIAHDLNNILSGIVSYPELLLMDLPKDSPLWKPIKTIQESGMRAADVVEDLLTIARGVATGKEVLNLNTTTEEYLDSAEHQKLEKTYPSINFKSELDFELLNITSSATHIKKILMNLVINSSEAIEGKGTVTVSTMNQYLDEPFKGYEDVRIGEYVLLSVSDDGSGISPGDLDRIFEPFYTKKVMGRSGTGLGLAVVWNSMQDHDGYINVKSNEKGTVFELYFPTTREQVADENEQVSLETCLGNGEKILVVDDEERQRDIANGILTRLGYTVEAVSSGEEAIKYVKKRPVDLILLDMVMPKGINGRETYEEIIKIHPGQKAIIASGYAKTKEVDLAQELGAGKYIKKPYALAKVGVAVKEELEN